MGSSYDAMVLQREIRTRKFPHLSTTTGIFMNASIIQLQMILVAHICIYLPSPLRIYPYPHKRVQYTPDMLPAAISVSSENSVITLTTSYDSLDILPTDDPNTLHVMKKDAPYSCRVKIGYCCRKHGQKRCYKKTRFSCSTCSDDDKIFYYCHGIYRLNSYRMI